MDLCQDMIDAGIEDPESAQGRTFCSSCIFSCCELYEPQQIVKTEAQELQQMGFSVETIGLTLDLTERTVTKYLKVNARKP